MPSLTQTRTNVELLPTEQCGEMLRSQKGFERRENVKKLLIAMTNGSDLISSVINHFPQYQLSSSPIDGSSPDKA